jgi:hypothetical protein
MLNTYKMTGFYTCIVHEHNDQEQTHMLDITKLSGYSHVLYINKLTWSYTCTAH